MKWYGSSMLLRGPVVRSLEAMASAGFDGIEVWVDQAVAHDEQPLEVAQAATAAGLGTTVHASSYDINLTAWNPGIRAESRRQTEQSLQFAADLGASIVVVHPGRRSSSRDAAEEYWPRMLQSLEPLDELANRLGLVVAVELMERRPKEIFFVAEDARRLAAHGLRSTGLTVDLAHLYTHGDPVELLDAFGTDEITHVHISDSDPDTVHLPLGEGDAPLAALVRRLAAKGYDRVINVEGYAPGRGIDLIEANAAAIRGLTSESPERAQS